MQCHAVNNYRKGTAVLTFAKTKKITLQCHMYKDCLKAVCYSREQAMTKQDNKKKKKPNMVQWSSLKIQSEIHIW